ncbi:uncharacterized protein METZ01_LOCUS5641, partial [marine metagenome]
VSWVVATHRRKSDLGRYSGSEAIVAAGHGVPAPRFVAALGAGER